MLRALQRCTRLRIFQTATGFKNNHVSSRTAHTTASLPTLFEQRPSFNVSSRQIKILSEPRQFYTQLINMIRSARKRILISTLYIGTEETELVQALHDALRKNPSLKVHMMLDLNRSTRLERASSTFPSTAHMLAPLIQAFPDRLTIDMFRSPKLRGTMERLVPPRFDEGWGTWHAKLYAVDDDFIISGANLNASYFSNRQDRYIHLSSQPQLVSYLSDFLSTISQFSYRLSPPSHSSASVIPRREKPYAMDAEDSGYHLSWNGFEHDSKGPASHPRYFEREAGDALRALQARYMSASSPSSSLSASQPNSQPALDEKKGEDTDTTLYPLIQSGILGIREEESALCALFDHLLLAHPDPSSGVGVDPHGERTERPLVELTSGYFALYEPYQARSLKRGMDWRILAASPNANGFLNSRGLSGRIPEGYTLLEQRYWMKVLKAAREWSSQREGGVTLNEWDRAGWTYHAKGIWITPPSSTLSSSSEKVPSSSSSSDPSITLFGSTNLNARSARLDTELSFLLTTSSPTLRAELGREVRGLWKHSGRVGVDEWKEQGREVGKVSWVTRGIVRLVGGML